MYGAALLKTINDATLMWLRVYKQQQPGWFRTVPAVASH